MLRIAVVEDEDTYAETLLGYIRRYVGESKETISAERFSDGANFVDEYRGASERFVSDGKPISGASNGRSRVSELNVF